jgi:hypothetical protein
MTEGREEEKEKGKEERRKEDREWGVKSLPQEMSCAKIFAAIEGICT